jgi:hypothetical protein
MVPGLDFNINEADNAPIETTFIELQQPAPRVTFSASQSQFNPDDLQWLVDIVDEETVAIAQPKRRPRFIFFPARPFGCGDNSPIPPPMTRPRYNLLSPKAIRLNPRG